MLETMRRNSRSAIIYVLFGILIAVFVLSFGPGSKGLGPTNASANVAAKIGGTTLTEQDFRFAYIAVGGGNAPPKIAKEQRLKETVMDLLIERELLAQEAEKMGFSVSQREVEDMIADGRMIVMGRPRRVDAYVYKDGNFDYDRFKLICQNQLGVSVVRFIEIQQRELLAEKAREALRMGIRVSPDEVKSEFEEHGRQVNLEFVRFSSRRFEANDDVDPAELAAYEKAHDADLKKTYEERKAIVYTKVEKQAKLRHVLVAVAKDAPADVVAKAKAKIDGAKKSIDDNQAFGDVAKRDSSDTLVQKKHGEMGWKKKGFAGLGQALDDKVFGAKKGDVLGPEKTDRGFEILLVEDFREGDVSYEQALPELAEQDMLRDKAKQKAKAEAQTAFDRAAKGEKLDAMFPVKKDANADDNSPQAQIARLMGGDEPQTKETGLFFRRGDVVQSIGVSKDLSKKAFDLKEGELAGPFEVANSYVIVRAKEKKDPDMKDFEKRRLELEEEASRVKWSEAVKSWSTDRCVEVRDAGKIRINDEVIAYEGVAPARPGLDKSAYVPCAPPRPMF